MHPTRMLIVPDMQVCVLALILNDFKTNATLFWPGFWLLTRLAAAALTLY